MNMKRSKVSVITVCYNAVNCIEKTIKSVLSQGIPDLEYIVVDGDSKDGTKDILNTYKSFISKCISEPDNGIYEAMNKAISLAEGDYCIFMNAGDTFASSHVLKDVLPVLGSYDIYNGNAIYIKDKKIRWYRKAQKDISLPFFYKSSICHQASFIRSSLLRKYKYDESLKLVSDWKFWIEAICKGRATYLPIDIDICFFDMSGLTNTQAERGAKERMFVIETLLSKEEKDACIIEVNRRQKSFLTHLMKGLSRRFWLYYAKIFKKETW